jgi:hypothetical protein
MTEQALAVKVTILIERLLQQPAFDAVSHAPILAKLRAARDHAESGELQEARTSLAEARALLEDSGVAAASKLAADITPLIAQIGVAMPRRGSSGA